MTAAGEERVSAISGYSVRECLSLVKNIRLFSRAYSEREETGIHKSRFRGRGIDLTDIREYAYGDDIRAMDWNVTARYQKPHVRIHTVEHDRTLYLMIDRSASSSFGGDLSKDVKILEIAATLLYSAVKEGDAAGILLFTDTVEKYIPARKGTRHAASVINTIISYNPAAKETDIGNAAEYLLGTLKRKSQIVILSDFYSPGIHSPSSDPAFLNPSSHDSASSDASSFAHAVSLLARRHDVQAIQVSDENEREMPDVGRVRISDPETGEQMVIDTSDREFREHYHKIADAHQENLTAYFRKNSIPALHIRTSDPYRDVFVKLNTFYRGPA